MAAKSFQKKNELVFASSDTYAVTCEIRGTHT